MSTKKLVFLLALAALTLPYFARSLYSQQRGPTVEDPAVSVLGDKIDGFFHNLTNLNLRHKEAFDELLAGGRLAEQDDSIKTLVTKTKEFDKRFGKYRSHERVAARRVGNDLAVLTYVYKGNDFPVVWYFTFYRDFRDSVSGNEVDDWVIIGVRFDTRLDSLNT